nr:thioesterase family protein [Nocardioides dongxiaopingii]
MGHRCARPRSRRGQTDAVRHLYQCPMRWADLDLLGHVNNVVYVDYLQEARVDLMRSLFPAPAGVQDDLADGVVVVRHEVTYLAPLTLTLRPVSIECWVTEVRAASFTMAYEVFHDDPGSDGGRHVYLRATTLLTPYVFATERPRRLRPDERGTLEPYVEPAVGIPAAPLPSVDRTVGHRYPLHVRFSDVDVYRHVNNVKYFEYFQESRVRLMDDLTRGTAAAESGPGFVVVQTDVDYRRPILLRPEPYDVWAEIARVGTRSMTIESEIADGETLLARSRVTLVFYDADTGRSTEPTAAMRDVLAGATRTS